MLNYERLPAGGVRPLGVYSAGCYENLQSRNESDFHPFFNWGNNYLNNDCLQDERLKIFNGAHDVQMKTNSSLLEKNFLNPSNDAQAHILCHFKIKDNVMNRILL